MTQIKCKYRRPICNCQMGAPCEYGLYCDWYETKPSCQLYDRTDFPEAVNDYRCQWLDYENVRFEKSVKSYEYDGWFLTMGRKWIPARLITHLEIDGEVEI